MTIDAIAQTPSVRPVTVPPAATAAAPASEAARKAGREFEAMFMARMLESMFSGLSSDGMFGGGQAEKTWRSFMIDEYAKTLAGTDSLGIGRMVAADVARLYQSNTEGEGA